MAMTRGLRRLLAAVVLGLAATLGGCAGYSSNGGGSRYDRGGYAGFSGGLNVGGGQGGEWHQ